MANPPESSIDLGSQPPSSGRSSVLPSDARATQGIWLFIGSLAVFFISSILLYVVYIAMRVQSQHAITQRMSLPWSFIPSTLLLVGVSLFLELAYRAAKRDRLLRVKQMAIGACVMGIGFLFIQSDGMKRLLDGLADAPTRNESAYGYTFILVFLHAAHVVGGAIGLWWTARNALANRYDHERNIGLKVCTLYWHFLDIVWVLLLISFWIALVLVNAKAPVTG
ncbi:MAG: cytochrome c oxidase subunit 3 [Planctomycetaceae bacterium]|nr:cytochrome c oxidase subunit 3 [Planctomycetaceae bacterium]